MLGPLCIVLVNKDDESSMVTKQAGVQPAVERLAIHGLAIHGIACDITAYMTLSSMPLSVVSNW